jgi:enterochelin esterase family protein
VSKATLRRAVLVSVVALGASGVDAALAQSTQGAAGQAARLRSPQIQSDRRVTFQLAASKASEVTLNGSWRGGANLSMTRDSTGTWTATVGPLQPELYEYFFSIDGVRTLDPGNSETARDGSRFSSLLMISGPESALWDFKDVPHGSLELIWYPSPILKQRQRRMYVYLPPGYHANPGQRYPVLYLLHGGSGDEDSWTTLGRAPVILDNLIAAGRAVAMIVVMPNGNPGESVSQGPALGPTPSVQQVNAPPPDPERWALHAPQLPEPYFGDFGESLVKDVIPFVERTYRVRAEASHRAIAGLSLGGAQTVVTSANNPALFDYIGVFSAGGMVGEPTFEAQLEALARDGIDLYWTGAGDDDIARLRNRALYEGARAKGLPATHRQVPGTHTWPLWRDFLADFAPRLFRPAHVGGAAESSRDGLEPPVRIPDQTVKGSKVSALSY